MNNEPKSKLNTAAATPAEERSDSGCVWVDGAPFTSEGGIFAYAPHLLTPDLLGARNEVTDEAASPRNDD